VFVLRTLVAALLVFLLARPSLAQSTPLELTWNAPPACPSAADVRHQFERLARAPDNRPPPHLVADAVIEESADGFHLRLHIVRDGLAGEREVDAKSCVSLARAAALELALAAGGGFAPDETTPDATPPSGTPANEASLPPQPSSPPAPDRATSPPPAPKTTPAPQTLAWWATLDARYAAGPLPGAALGSAAGVDVASSWWMATARVVTWPRDRDEPLAGLHATFAGFGGSVSLCAYAGSNGALIFAGCAGLQASALRGSSSGGSESGSAVAAWYAALPGARVRLHLVGRLSLDLGVESALSLTRPRFELRGWPSPVHTVPVFAPSASLGLSMRI
jgi:hypothetical protein